MVCSKSAKVPLDQIRGEFIHLDVRYGCKSCKYFSNYDYAMKPELDDFAVISVS